MKLSNENQMTLNIVPLFGAPKKQLPTVGRLFSFLFSIHSRERPCKNLRKRRLKLHVFVFDGMMEAEFVGVKT